MIDHVGVSLGGFFELARLLMAPCFEQQNRGYIAGGVDTGEVTEHFQGIGDSPRFRIDSGKSQAGGEVTS